MADESPRRQSSHSGNNQPCSGPLGDRIHYQELPQRRHSDGVDPTMRSGEGAVGGRPFPAIPNLTLRNGAQLFAARPRPQSESDVQLERRLGQELRRISDEFHMSYQQIAVARLRRNSQPNDIHHSNSFPERRGSVIERLGEMLGFLPRHGDQVTEETDEVDSSFVPRRRAYSEIFMASGLTTSCFGRMDSVITDTDHSGGQSDSDHDSENDDEGPVTFNLSMEES